MIGNLISAGASLLGGLFNRETAESNNAAVLADKEKDRQLQETFAKNSLGWRIEDAAKYGIHPLAAIGNGASYSPSAISLSGDSMGQAMASAGQDIGRAINATRTGPQRDAAFQKSVEALSLQKMGLENELLSSQIQRLKANNNPPMPSSDGWNASSIGPVAPQSFPEDKPSERPPIAYGGRKFMTDPGSVNAEEIEKRYGDIAQEIGGLVTLWNDMKANWGEPHTWPGQANSRFWGGVVQDARRLKKTISESSAWGRARYGR